MKNYEHMATVFGPDADDYAQFVAMSEQSVGPQKGHTGWPVCQAASCPRVPLVYLDDAEIAYADHYMTPMRECRELHESSINDGTDNLRNNEALTKNTTRSAQRDTSADERHVGVATIAIKLLLVLTTVIASLIAGVSYCAEPTSIKIATAAPKGTAYHRALQEMCEAVQNNAGSKTRCIVYPDSIQGTEDDVVRRMRIGQIDASLLTVVGLHDIDPSVTALGYMPMMFRSWDEMDYVRENLRPELEKKLASKGFIVLFWGEGGWVQFFTKEQITKPDEYKKGKIFTWAGDGDQINIMKKIGFNPVGVQITDILPGLETGMIDIVPVASMWVLVGQLDRVTHYMLPIRWAPIVGATVIRRQTLDSMSPDMREALLSAGRAAGIKLRESRSAIDDDAIRALQNRGVKILSVTPEVERAWEEVAESVWQQERNTMVPGETFDQVRAALAEYRKAAKAR